MFHEFLSQFEDGTDNRIRRQNPKFGLRWLTWPSNTLLAAIAWRNRRDKPAKLLFVLIGATRR